MSRFIFLGLFVAGFVVMLFFAGQHFFGWFTRHQKAKSDRWIEIKEEETDKKIDELYGKKKTRGKR